MVRVGTPKTPLASSPLCGPSIPPHGASPQHCYALNRIGFDKGAAMAVSSYKAKQMIVMRRDLKMRKG
ncbi:MAG: hypothetical protein Q4A07_12840, partial [Coriobacteriales bacterium]|nr:hypothetical protein [Coriobacteriales bacterium]